MARSSSLTFHHGNIEILAHYVHLLLFLSVIYLFDFLRAFAPWVEPFKRKVLTLVKYNLSDFLFYGYCFPCPKKLCLSLSDRECISLKFGSFTLRLGLWPILNYFLCMVWGSDCGSFSPYGCPVVGAPFVEKTFLSPSGGSVGFVKSQLTG